MTYSQAYRAHHSRMVKESIVKSAILSFLVGLSAAIIIAVSTMFIDFNGLWIALGACFGLTAAIMPVLYFVKFRPSEKSVAERLDRMGFDERMVTMMELAGNDSVMAQIQRNDAQSVIAAAAEKNGGAPGSLSAAQKRAAVGLTTKNIIIGSIVLAIAIVSLVLTGLPPKQVKGLFVPPTMYSIKIGAGDYGYLVIESNGYVYNDKYSAFYNMSIKEGGSSEKVVVTARDDIITTETDAETGEKYDVRHAYMFVGWSDGYYDKYNAASRYEENVRNGNKVNALYEEIELEKDIPVGGSTGDGENNNNSNSNNPDIPTPPDSEGNNGSNGSDSERLPPPDDPNQTPPSNSGSNLGNGNVIDGGTDYGSLLPGASDSAMGNITGNGNNGGSVPPGLGGAVGDYFGSL